MVEPPRIAGLEIERELGRGASSVVYRGHWQGTPCAVKVLRVRSGDRGLAYREAVSLARVKDRHLPRVLEVDDVDGVPFIVMELVEGPTLAEKLEAGPLAESAAIAIARQLTSALIAIHDAGLVHRDVKPRNIVLDRASETLKLVDFGFAVPIDRLLSDDTAGTAGYAAPEQLDPASSSDGRADLFAVGRILVECIRGARADRNDQTGSDDLKPGLAVITSGLLRPAVDERYRNGRAVLADLDRYVEGAAVLGPKGYPLEHPPIEAIRRRELDDLLERCRDVSAGGSIVVLHGRRGSGKTRIQRAAAAKLSTASRILQAAAYEGDSPLATLRRILEAYDDDAGIEELGNLSTVVRMIGASSSAAREGASRDLGGASDSLGEAAADMLIRIAVKAGPLVLFIDDAQWLDAASTEALVRVGHRVAEAPLSVVLAVRSESSARALAPFEKVRADARVIIDLPTLDAEQVRALVASHLGDARVSTQLSEHVRPLADGTPLGVLEVLGAFLDAGVVRPSGGGWSFERERVKNVVIPAGALAFLGRRLAEVAPQTRSLLEAAAVIGRSIDDRLLLEVAKQGVADANNAMALARQGGFLVAAREGAHQFAHDSLRETVLEQLDDAKRRQLHDRVASVLDNKSSRSFDETCAAAKHSLSAGLNPARVYRLARVAGEEALARFDNTSASQFLLAAREAAEGAGLVVEPSLFQSIAEAHVRLGNLDDSVAAFESALAHAAERRQKARILSRLSWVHLVRADPHGAWRALEQAFSVMNARLPAEDARSFAATGAHVLRSRARRWVAGRRRLATSQEVEHDTDILCTLHYQNARLGLEYGKPSRLIQSALECVELSEVGASQTMRARAHAFNSLAVTALGRRAAGARESRIARDIAVRTSDSATIAFCAQVEATATIWAGEIERAFGQIKECIALHGPWIDVGELCHLVESADMIIALRGRCSDSWPWLQQALDRLRRSRSQQCPTYIIQRARASLAALGRTATDDPWLAEWFDQVPLREPGRGSDRLSAWGPRAHTYLELGDFGSDFEEMIADFEGDGHDPRKVHLVAGEYYIAVAHARLHQAIRKAGGAAAEIRQLRRAAADLRGIARIPIFTAHSVYIDACLDWFEGRLRKARGALSRAETVAEDQLAPWLRYGVARMRAHILRSEGKEAAARDEARIAEVFAERYGAAKRARWVREEFAA